MQRHDIPTAGYESFVDADAACAYINRYVVEGEDQHCDREIMQTDKKHVRINTKNLYTKNKYWISGFVVTNVTAIQ